MRKKKILPDIGPFTPPLKRGSISFLLWSLALPFSSLLGAVRISKLSKGGSATVSNKLFEEKSVLIVGSGPSLDLVGDDFLGSYDVIICLNYAVIRVGKKYDPMFFTTDVGVLINLISEYGVNLFERVRKNGFIVAPIFLEQINSLPRAYWREFIWLRANSLTVKMEKMKQGSVLGLKGLPYSARFSPRQLPNVTIMPGSRGEEAQLSQIPILGSTSAISATCFAANAGARKVDLIGCDFSSGRAKIVGTSQPLPTDTTFAGARDSFLHVQGVLAAQGVAIENLSWTIPNQLQFAV